MAHVPDFFTNVVLCLCIDLVFFNRRLNTEIHTIHCSYYKEHAAYKLHHSAANSSPASRNLYLQNQTSVKCLRHLVRCIASGFNPDMWLYLCSYFFYFNANFDFFQS